MFSPYAIIALKFSSVILRSVSAFESEGHLRGNDFDAIKGQVQLSSAEEHLIKAEEDLIKVFLDDTFDLGKTPAKKSVVLLPVSSSNNRLVDTANVISGSLTGDVLDKAYVAAIMSEAVYGGDEFIKKKNKSIIRDFMKPLVENLELQGHTQTYDVTKMKVFTDPEGLTSVGGDDYAALYKLDDVCYIAWRGTDMDDSMWDAIQNVAFLGEDFVGPQGTCNVMSASKNSYDMGSATDAMLMDVRSCVSSCTTACDLVITGHSQGGGAAMVGAVALADLDPYMITFGQPSTYRNGICGAVDHSRTYRFVNTEIASADSIVNGGSAWAWEDGLYYDRVARLFMDCKFGQYIILPEEPSKLIMYQHGDRDISYLAPKSVGKAHLQSEYVRKLRAIVEAREVSVGLNLWSSGTPCYFDRECQNSCEWVDLGSWWDFKGRYECD